MTEEKIQCGEGTKYDSDCDFIPEGFFRSTQLTNLQVSGLSYLANHQEQL